jgi:RecA/RadA recombinase
MASSPLIDRLRSRSAKGVEQLLMSETDFASPEHITKCRQHLFDVLFGGHLKHQRGGLTPGLHVFAGAPASYKTQAVLHAVKSYLHARPNGVCVFYDNEYGGAASWEALDIPLDRVLHVPVMTAEELKFDMMQKFDELDRGDEVMMMIDSIGMMGSKKEAQDALDQNSKTDMTRAKEIRSVLRLATPRFNYNYIPCLAINHTAMSIGGYVSQEVMGGGTAMTYAPNSIFFTSKTKLETDSDEATDRNVAGWWIKLRTIKSRLLKEKTEFAFPILYGQDELSVRRRRGAKSAGAWQKCHDF